MAGIQRWRRDINAGRSPPSGRRLTRTRSCAQYLGCSCTVTVHSIGTWIEITVSMLYVNIMIISEIPGHHRACPGMRGHAGANQANRANRASPGTTKAVCRRNFICNRYVTGISAVFTYQHMLARGLPGMKKPQRSSGYRRAGSPCGRVGARHTHRCSRQE